MPWWCALGFPESDNWILTAIHDARLSSYFTGETMPSDECRRRRLWKISSYSKIAFESSIRVFHRFRSRSSACMRLQNDSIIALSFREILESSGVETVKLPARSPNLNAYAERFVRSIESECLAQIIPPGEEHLHHAVKEYTEHYHIERNHQGLENRLIEKSHGAIKMNSAVERHERLGGILNYYERRAA